MKKFCSECGSQLELSQRLCEKCGAVNPFFVAAFTFLSDQSEALERLRVEKEKIEKELKEKEEAQAEFRKQEMLRKQKEENDRSKIEQSEKDRLNREFEEREKTAGELRKELQRIKEETERYKAETYHLVSEVKEELQQIEIDNKRLQEEINNITLAGSKVPPKSEPKSTIRSLWFLLLTVIFLSTSAAVAYLLVTRPDASKRNIEIQTPVSEQRDTVLSLPVDTISLAEVAMEDSTQLDSLFVEDLVAEKNTSTNDIPKVTQPVAPARPKEFNLSATKIKSDLAGKKVSGCGIIIQDASEIKGVGKIALVEKLPSGYLKFSCTINIEQDGESYNAKPYLYYTADGIFIKIDGTNCE